MAQQLWATGSNSDGQLGIGHYDDVDTPVRCVCKGEEEETFPPTGSRVVRIASSARWTAALLSETPRQGDAHQQEKRTLWLSGHAYDQQCDPCFRRCSFLAADAAIMDIAATWDCTYVVVRTSENGDEIYALGTSNSHGQWGCGRTAIPGIIHQVRLDLTKTKIPIEFGTRWRVLAMEGGVRHVMAAVALQHASGAAGADTTYAEAVVGWGHARHGQLRERPPSGTERRPLGVWYEPVMVEVWSRRDQPSESAVPSADPEADASSAVSWKFAPACTYSLALGMHHSVVAVHTGEATQLYTYGSNRHGQCGLGHSATRQGYARPACNWHTTFVCSDAGGIEAWGANQHAQMAGAKGVFSRGGRLSCGSEHCVLQVGTEAYGWGWNEHGNLGCRSSDAETPRRIAVAQATQGQESSKDEHKRQLGHVWTGYGTTWLMTVPEKTSRNRDDFGAAADATDMSAA